MILLRQCILSLHSYNVKYSYEIKQNIKEKVKGLSVNLFHITQKNAMSTVIFSCTELMEIQPNLHNCGTSVVLLMGTSSVPFLREPIVPH